MITIRRYAAEDAHIIYGAAYDDSLGDQMRVTMIATDLNRGRPAAAPLTVAQPSAGVQFRTGTDNLPILNQVAQAGQNGQGSAGDYSGLSTFRSVWRSARTQAAAKVEALPSNGMDEIEIPAFCAGRRTEHPCLLGGHCRPLTGRR